MLHDAITLTVACGYELINQSINTDITELKNT